MGIKPSDPKKYLTPAPGAYKPEHSEKYLDEKIQHSMGMKIKDPKKYITPAPNKYEVKIIWTLVFKYEQVTFLHFMF